VKIALRTQQIIAHESGVTDTADPLGGSYYLEWLTDKMESEAKNYFDKLDAMGGMVPAIERGFPQGEIHRAAVSYQKEVDARERIIVGVNSFVEPEKSRVSILKVKDAVEKKQVLRLRQRKKSRGAKKVGLALNRLAGVAEASGDLMPAVMEAVRAEATVGEICELFRRVYGGYREAALI
jgi:methylmalonyl-CoA mutase N-terminal domain/subunit